MMKNLPGDGDAPSPLLPIADPFPVRLNLRVAGVERFSELGFRTGGPRAVVSNQTIDARGNIRRDVRLLAENARSRNR